MPPATTLRETQIPLPHDPATAGGKATPETAARLCVALRNLVWLFTYVTVMRLLGYRIPRPPAGPKSAKPAQSGTPAATPAIPPAAPPTPRAKHRYLDRAMCLNMLADISSAFAPAPPASEPASADPATAQPPINAPGATRPRAPTSRPRPGRPSPRPPNPARSNPSGAVARPRDGAIRAAKPPPSRQKTTPPRTPTHALFVAIS